MVESDNLVWMDLEMTGLDPKENKIIEVATVITDRNLQIIAESEVFAIHRSEDEFLREHLLYVVTAFGRIVAF